MMARPILRPIPCLRASFRIVSSLTGKTVPARSRAMTYFVIPLGTGARGAVDVRARLYRPSARLTMLNARDGASGAPIRSTYRSTLKPSASGGFVIF